MTLRKLACGLIVVCVSLLAAGRSQAIDAFCDTCCEHDLQFFAPVDFDYNCNPIERECGWFFNYSRLYWTLSGERTTIGAPGLIVDSEQVFAQNPFDLGVAASPYPIINGIQDAPPNADWGWGHRYEFGYEEGGNGWLIGVLDGPRQSSSEVYGFQELTIPGQVPVSNQLTDPNFAGTNVNVTGFFLSGAYVNGAYTTTTQNGFGSVHVNFEVTPDLLLGFRDYHVNGPNNEASPTLNGPWIQLNQITTANGVVTAFGLQINVDGIVDDVDGDGETFGFVFTDVNANGVFDEDTDVIIGTFVDHGDLYRFNTRFTTLTVRNHTNTDGIEVMRTLELDNSHLPVKEQRNRFEIAYGARYLKIDDGFAWDGDLDVMGRTYQSTDADNNIVGPQVRARWTHQRHRLNFALDGRFAFGYNVQNLKQRGGIGQQNTPGALNRSVLLQPTSFAYGRQDNDFSPLAELRADVRYQFTGAIAARLGYTGMFVDNITRASQIVRYRLPDMGISEGGQQNMFINGVDFGFEAVY